MFYFAFVPIGFLLGMTFGVFQHNKRKAYQIKFIDDRELENFLSEKNIKKDIYCDVCRDKITQDNIGIFTVKEGKEIYICDKEECQKLNNIIKS